MYPNFGSLGMLGFKLLPELIFSHLKHIGDSNYTYQLMNFQSRLSGNANLAEKWAINARNGGPTR